MATEDNKATARRWYQEGMAGGNCLFSRTLRRLCASSAPAH